MTPLEIIAALNALLTLTANAGIAWSRLRAAIDKANAEGRPFTLADLDDAATHAHTELQKLREAIAKAKAGAPPA